MVRQIPLSQGKVALVDDEDYDAIAAHRWYACRNRNRWYARRTVRQGGKKQGIWMHRVITNAPPGVDVDHKNHDGLDNQQGNLRLATRSQNLWNLRPNPKNSSGFRGVVRSRHHWKAQARHLGKTIYLGMFASPEAAAHAYDDWVIKNRGEFAHTNKSEGQIRSRIAVEEIE